MPLEHAGSLELLSFNFDCFFQAEDGIRDLTVTGVQTCALPISISRPAPGGDAAQLRGDMDDAAAAGRDHHRQDGTAHQVGTGDVYGQHAGPFGGRDLRSEERRVGEEGRSWWSPYH